MPTSRKCETLSSLTMRLMYFTPAFVWGFFVLYFSLMPGDEVPDVLANLNDKIIHAFIYFISAALIYLGFIRYSFSNAITGKALWMIIAVCTIVGAVVEVLQHFWVENRNGDWQDFLANTLGSLMCVLLFRIVHGLRA